MAIETVWNSSLKFINSTFFEILVCTSVSMSMIQHVARDDLFGAPDIVSVALSLVFVVILLAYIIFVSYFTFFKSK